MNIDDLRPLNKTRKIPSSIKPLIVRERLSKRPRRKAKKPKPLETFAMIPRALTQNPAKFGLDVFEFAILAGLLRVEAETWQQDRDIVARQAGNRAMVRYQQRNGRRRDGRFDTRADTARRNGYHKRMTRLKATIPEIVTFEIFPSVLLRSSGLSRSAANLGRIDDALIRLRSSVIEDMPPLLISHRVLMTGKVRFHVSGDWMRGSRIKMPIPLPTKSNTALNLLLFLRSIGEPGQDGMSIAGSIALAKLCDWIGMEPCYPSEQVRRLHDAVSAIYQCLQRNKTKDHRRRNDIPDGYGFSIENGRVRFGQARRGQA